MALVCDSASLLGAKEVQNAPRITGNLELEIFRCACQIRVLLIFYTGGHELLGIVARGCRGSTQHQQVHKGLRDPRSKQGP